MYGLSHFWNKGGEKLVAYANESSIPIAVTCPGDINGSTKSQVTRVMCFEACWNGRYGNFMSRNRFFIHRVVYVSVELHYPPFIRKLLLQIHIFFFIRLYSKVKSHFSKITHFWIQRIFIVIAKQSSTWYVYIIWLARGLCIRERPLISRLRNNKITIFNIPTFNITALQCRWVLKLIHNDLVFRIVAHSIPKRSIQTYHRHPPNSLISI